MTQIKTEFIDMLPFDLDNYQEEAIDMINALPKGKNLLVTLPTGSGKTLIGEYAIWKAFKHNKRTIYVNPLKALSTEKLNTWRENYLSDLVVMRDTSDDIETRTPENYERYNVLITTNERLNSVLRKEKQREMVFKNVEYFIIDEIHLLGSKGRGTTLEYIIMVLQELMPHIKIIGLSATLPNYLEFAEWLNAEYIYLPPDKRPVPLEYIFCDPILDGNVNQMTQDKFFMLRDIIRQYPRDQFLISVSSRLRAENLVKRMSGLSPRDHVDIKSLANTKYAYHHAGLDKEERSLVEKRFIKGVIKVLFATPTLFQGVNLPVKNVVIFDLKRWSIFAGDHEFIEHYEIGQAVGRAGRRGYDTFGRCFYLGTEEEIEHAIESVEKPQDMRSRIYETLDDHILALRVSNLVNNQQDIENIFQKSFLIYQSPQTSFLIPDEIDFLFKHGFLRKSPAKSDLFFPTRFGILSSKFYVKPRTANEIYQNIIQNIDESVEMTELDIIKEFLKTGEFLLNIRIGGSDHRFINASRQVLGLDDSRGAPPLINVTIYNPEKNKYEIMDLSNNYMKAMGLIFSSDLDVQVFGSKRELYTIRKMASEIIQKAHVVLKTRKEYHKKIHGIEFRVQIASKMVEYGKLNPKDVYLLLVDGIGEKRYKKLKRAGIRSLSEFFFASERQLSQILSLREEAILEMKNKSAKTIPLDDLYKEELKIDASDLER